MQSDLCKRFSKVQVINACRQSGHLHSHHRHELHCSGSWALAFICKCTISQPNIPVRQEISVQTLPSSAPFVMERVTKLNSRIFSYLPNTLSLSVFQSLLITQNKYLSFAIHLCVTSTCNLLKALGFFCIDCGLNYTAFIRHFWSSDQVKWIIVNYTDFLWWFDWIHSKFIVLSLSDSGFEVPCTIKWLTLL